MWFISTFRPVLLGSFESEVLHIFANSGSHSVYKIFKKFNSSEEGEKIKGPSYKDVHKRVKRLEQLKLINKIEGHFERGAKYYEISSYGLLIYLNNELGEVSEFIDSNRRNIIFQELLYFFENRTISSFCLKDFPGQNIGEYLHDCASATINLCKRFWIELERVDLIHILPPDEIIQDYMSYLDGKKVEKDVLDEIKKYNERLQEKLYDNEKGYNNEFERKELTQKVERYNDHYFSIFTLKEFKREGFPCNRDYPKERPPFPFLEMYYKLIWYLRAILEEKAKSLVFNIVSSLGDIVGSEKIVYQEQLEELFHLQRDVAFLHIVKDKKFFKVLTELKKDFDLGYNQFLYYH
jgi:hypothetical protein